MNGLRLVLLNVIVTMLLVFLVVRFGDTNPLIDKLDIAIESAKTLVQFFLFFLIALAQVKRSIRNMLLLGTFGMQIGTLFDMLDEFVEFQHPAWHLVGDVIFLVASITTALGATKWVMHNYKMASMDKLTGVYNRRYFESVLEQVFSRIQRSAEEACLMLIDLDDFKKINDQFGHNTGDDVLKLVGRVLLNCSRVSDVVSRSGGEEFEILLSDCSLDNGVEVGNRILQEMAEKKPEELENLTASIGLTKLVASDDIKSARARADRAMYDAKHNGKAQIKIDQHDIQP